ncbi:MAG: glycosyltransferase family 2 protein, partial [Candidatus Aenigmarchaeota archaeon]|nr:glycosyltransferase family 2 protein [Candidatus Aenigmarchaeota archaeon]
NFLKNIYSMYIFRPLTRLYSSETSILSTFKKINKKIMKVNFINRCIKLMVPTDEKKAVSVKKKDYRVYVVIPAYNEELNIGECINHAFNQTVKPEKVIVVDDCSTDRTVEMCKLAKGKYRDLVIIEKEKNMGKSHSLSHAMKNFFLGDVAIFLDADTFMSKNYIEEIVKPFDDEKVMISTGISTPIMQRNIFGRIIFRGSVFQYLFFCFRKEAQMIRNAVSVVCGDSAAYRASFLKKVGKFPEGTNVEDMDMTWKTLEMGHRISFQKNAFVRCVDPSTFKGHCKQVFRWYTGGFQCLYKHGRNLFKAKSLFLTTLMPTYFDIFVYSPIFISGPVLFFFFPEFFTWFYFADLLFTVFSLTYIDKRMLLNLPEVYIIKFLWCSLWLTAAFKVTFEYIGGTRRWNSTWNRDEFYATPKDINLIGMEK